MSLFENAKKSKTFCILPWMHQYVGPTNDIRPCCVYDSLAPIGDFSKESLKEIWNNSSMKQLRVDMLNGVEIPECRFCNIRAELGSMCIRTNMNNMYLDKCIDIINETHDDGALDTYKLLYLDARAGNCNCKCRTCGVELSSGWLADHNVLGLVSHTMDMYTDSKKQYEQILPSLSNLECIYFAGGEPLMHKYHYDILEELIRLKKGTHNGESPCSIMYNTNGTLIHLDNYKILDVWSKFNDIAVHVSVDASDEVAEYWRKGTNWDVLKKNCIALSSRCPDVIFNVGFTLSWVNAYELFKLHKSWVDQNIIGINNFRINILDTPVYINIKYIPKWKKEKLVVEFEKYRTWLISAAASAHTVSIIDHIIQYIDVENDTEITNDIVNGFNQLITDVDAHRNENFWEIFPIHADMKSIYKI